MIIGVAKWFCASKSYMECSSALLRVVVFAWKEERWENINYLARRAEQALKTFSAEGESGGRSKNLFSL